MSNCPDGYGRLPLGGPSTGIDRYGVASTQTIFPSSAASTPPALAARPPPLPPPAVRPPPSQSRSGAMPRSNAIPPPASGLDANVHFLPHAHRPNQTAVQPNMPLDAVNAAAASESTTPSQSVDTKTNPYQCDLGIDFISRISEISNVTASSTPAPDDRALFTLETDRALRINLTPERDHAWIKHGSMVSCRTVR